MKKKLTKKDKAFIKELDMREVTKKDLKPKDWNYLQKCMRQSQKEADAWHKKEIDKLNSTRDPLTVRIEEYINIKEIGEVITACADTVMRRYLASPSTKINKGHYNKDQSDIALCNEKYLKALMDKKGHVNSLVYKIIELGELLKCRELWGECEYAKECWVTRRGFCENEKRKRNEKKV